MSALPAGTKVRLEGLTAAHLNGVHGMVVGPLEEDGRYPVKLLTPSARSAHGNGVRVKPDNLRVAKEPKEPTSAATDSRDHIFSSLAGAPTEARRKAAELMVGALLRAIAADLYPSGAEGGV